MAEDQNERRWVVEPAQPGEVSLHMAFGENVRLTEEQEAAIAALLRTLEAVDAEVTGLAKCSRQGSCTKLTCDPVSCNLKCGTLKAAITQSSAGSWNLMGNFARGIQ